MLKSIGLQLGFRTDPIFIGTLGVDRFYIGDVGLGIGKLLTGGGCGIWWLIDIFLITDATKQKNLEQLSWDSRYLVGIGIYFGKSKKKETFIYNSS